MNFFPLTLPKTARKIPPPSPTLADLTAPFRLTWWAYFPLALALLKSLWLEQRGQRHRAHVPVFLCLRDQMRKHILTRLDTIEQMERLVTLREGTAHVLDASQNPMGCALNEALDKFLDRQMRQTSQRALDELDGTVTDDVRNTVRSVLTDSMLTARWKHR